MEEAFHRGGDEEEEEEEEEAVRRREEEEEEEFDKDKCGGGGSGGGGEDDDAAEPEKAFVVPCCQALWQMPPAMSTISSSSSVDPTQVVSRICPTLLFSFRLSCDAAAAATAATPLESSSAPRHGDRTRVPEAIRLELRCAYGWKRPHRSPREAITWRKRTTRPSVAMLALELLLR